VHKPSESESLGTLVLHFFDYYGNTFPYGTSYISVSEGKLLPKSSARWIADPASDRLAVQCLVRNGEPVCAIPPNFLVILCPGCQITI
jgi:non-canonical poly(A) RNA polymerase PAPD5/7